MSLVVRVISMANGSPRWYAPWPPSEVITGSVPPPAAFIAAHEVTGYPYFYITIGPAADSFFNSFFGRVPKWKMGISDALPAIPDLEITAGNTVGLTEPFVLGFDGGTGWTAVDNPPPVIVGDRGIYIKKEEQLPHPNPNLPPAEDDGSFQYSRTRSFQNDASPSANITLNFRFKMLGHLMIQFGSTAYIPCDFFFGWEFVDDGGASSGGYLTNIADMPFFGGYGEQNLSLLFRLATQKFGENIHMAHGFTAYEFNSYLASQPGGPDRTLTIAETTDQEIGGHTIASNIWVQPDTAGTMDTYYGYRIDNDDDRTAQYFPTGDFGGHRTSKKDLPLTMNPAIARELLK